MCSYFYIAKNSHKYIVRGKWGEKWQVGGKMASVTLCGFFFVNVLWASLMYLVILRIRCIFPLYIWQNLVISVV